MGEPITKELREYVEENRMGDGIGVETMWGNSVPYDLLQIADRIDAEHERRMDGAVSVVRCGECKWLRTFDGRCLCVRDRSATRLVDWDDYCSEGVRWVEELSSYGGVPPVGKVGE